ncbi:MAG: xanthine dehydrogenase FAD-binding subunit XdhB, partial [Clostridia bacterium]|nr:xanthine dehydrogenase FAD-binding subunit XdhB [Clostridia bacterium]
MYGVKTLYEPESLQKALEVLSHDDEAKIIAGGTDLLLKMRNKGLRDVSLLSLHRIRELKRIE